MNKLLEFRNKLMNGNGKPAPADSGKQKITPDKQAKPKPNAVTPGKFQPEFETVFINTPEEAQAVLENLSTEEITGLDIETTGLCPHQSHIRLLQLCQSLEKVYVFDIYKVGLDILRDFLSQGKFVAHNAEFELSFLYHAGIELPYMHCSLLMDNALTNGRRSLKDVAKAYLKMDISKDQQNSDWSTENLSQEQLKYAALDAWLVVKLQGVMMDSITSQKRAELYELLRQAQYPVMKLQYNGVHYDAVAHQKLMNRTEEELKTAEAEVRQVVGNQINLNSTKQLSEFYSGKLNRRQLRQWKKTPSGGLSFNKDVLNKLQNIPAVKPLARYSTLKHRLSSFGNNLLKYVNTATGRLHPNFAMGIAKGGRFSCSSPNVQQIPKDYEYRSMFSAPKGKKIIVADYSQVELRILAMITKDRVMLEAYREGRDLHTLTASAISGVELENVTKEQRSAAKAVNFGLIFGMGAWGLSEYAKNSYNVNMSQSDAEQAKAQFFNKYPDVKKWYDRTSRGGILTKTRMGRVVKLDNRHTESKNVPVQGSAAEVLLAALVELDKITGPGVKLVNIIHDEIVLEVDEDRVEEATKNLEEAMVNGMLRVFPECETRELIEYAVGDSWGDAK